MNQDKLVWVQSATGKSSPYQVAVSLGDMIDDVKEKIIDEQIRRSHHTGIRYILRPGKGELPDYHNHLSITAVIDGCLEENSRERPLWYTFPKTSFKAPEIITDSDQK
jgi:hypothetical protein